MITKGSRWLIGDGKSVDVWGDRWLPRPKNFKVITPKVEFRVEFKG